MGAIFEQGLYSSGGYTRAFTVLAHSPWIIPWVMHTTSSIFEQNSACSFFVLVVCERVRARAWCVFVFCARVRVHAYVCVCACAYVPACVLVSCFTWPMPSIQIIRIILSFLCLCRAPLVHIYCTLDCWSNLSKVNRHLKNVYCLCLSGSSNYNVKENKLKRAGTCHSYALLKNS